MAERIERISWIIDGKAKSPDLASAINVLIKKINQLVEAENERVKIDK